MTNNLVDSYLQDMRWLGKGRARGIHRSVTPKTAGRQREPHLHTHPLTAEADPVTRTL